VPRTTHVARCPLRIGTVAAAVLAFTLAGLRTVPGPFPLSDTAVAATTPASDITGAASCPTATWAAEVTDAGTVAWKVPLPSSPTGGLPAPLVINGIALFAGNSDLTAVRVAGGHRLWDIHIDHPGNPLPGFFWGLWQWDGNAYALINYSTYDKTDERLVEINPATGKVRWQLKLRGPVASFSAPADAGVVALAVGGTVEAVDLENGGVSWSRPFGKPDGSGYYQTTLVMTAGFVVAASSPVSGAGTGTAAGFDAQNGTEQWERTGFPEISSLTADGSTVLIDGYDISREATSYPVTALAVQTGETRWHVPVKGTIAGIWTTPTGVVFTDDARIYEADPVTGLRWSIPGRPQSVLLTATDLLYSQWKEVSPVKPFRYTVFDRRLNDAAVRWTQSHAPYDILAPTGPNLLLANSDPLSTDPGTAVYAVNAQTGKQVSAWAKLPAGVFAAPAVLGSDVIFQLNPWQCVSAGKEAARKGAA
jgi:outer membrane protein assembly factor BamB